jgi:hypothetical protein
VLKVTVQLLALDQGVADKHDAVAVAQFEGGLRLGERGQAGKGHDDAGEGGLHLLIQVQLDARSKAERRGGRQAGSEWKTMAGGDEEPPARVEQSVTASTGYRQH